MTAWPKLFHNLWASRQTDLAATLPIHVVCAWLGNSPAIATQHYVQRRTWRATQKPEIGRVPRCLMSGGTAIQEALENLRAMQRR